MRVSNDNRGYRRHIYTDGNASSSRSFSPFSTYYFWQEKYASRPHRKIETICSRDWARESNYLIVSLKTISSNAMLKIRSSFPYDLRRRGGSRFTPVSRSIGGRNRFKRSTRRSLNHERKIHRIVVVGYFSRTSRAITRKRFEMNVTLINICARYT